LRGKIVFLNIFSAEEHHPEMSRHRELAAALNDKPFAGVNVSIDKHKETFARWLQREPSTWRAVWCGKHSDIYADWLFDNYATNYLIDAQGILRAFQVGWADLPDQVEQLLEKMEKK